MMAKIMVECLPYAPPYTLGLRDPADIGGLTSQASVGDVGLDLSHSAFGYHSAS
jgi:hypothetical protein